MNYIRLDENNLELSLIDKEPEKGFVIPINKSRYDVLVRGFHGLVYFDVLYPYNADEDKAKGISGISYKLFEPDPWLVALAAIMWQGLIQGFTWDIIKLSVIKGINFLRSKALLDEEPYQKRGMKKSQKIKSSDLEIGFSWTQFSEDGEPLKKFF